MRLVDMIFLPYNIITGVFKSDDKYKFLKNKNIIAEEKQEKEEVLVVEGVRSAYDKPNPPKKETDPVKIAQAKQANALKRQGEYEKLVQKARLEEQKRLKEQERRIKEQQQKEIERLKKEEEKAKKEEMFLKKNGSKKKVRKARKYNSLYEQIEGLLLNMTYGKGKSLELKARQTVLNENFKDKDPMDSRFAKALQFEYIARNPNGVLEKSMIEALSRADVYSFLKAEGYEVYDVTVAKGAGSIEIGSYKFKRSRLIFYLSQLSAYLKSGLALAEAVKILDNQAKDRNEKKVLRAVYYDLTMGDNLSTAMAKRKTAFPKLLINMIKTAEMTGDLNATLDSMVDYYTEIDQTKKQMISALIYPAFVLVFAIAVVIFMLVSIIPKFLTMYEGSNKKIPATTRFVKAVSDFLINGWMYLLPSILIIVVLIIILYKNVKPFKKLLQEIAMHIPVFGNIIIYNEVAVFSRTFANLLNHNVFITDSIDVLSKITENEVYKELIFDTANNLTKGESVSAAFKNHWAFPEIAYQMLLTGEKTGRLGPMMEKVATYFEEQHRNIIGRMKSLIEPILIVSLAGIVGFILLSVIMPMFDSYSIISEM